MPDGSQVSKFLKTRTRREPGKEASLCMPDGSQVSKFLKTRTRREPGKEASLFSSHDMKSASETRCITYANPISLAGSQALTGTVVWWTDTQRACVLAGITWPVPRKTVRTRFQTNGLLRTGGLMNSQA
jgi:hypothetical protein